MSRAKLSFKEYMLLEKYCMKNKINMQYLIEGENYKPSSYYRMIPKFKRLDEDNIGDIDYKIKSADDLAKAYEKSVEEIGKSSMFSKIFSILEPRTLYYKKSIQSAFKKDALKLFSVISNLLKQSLNVKSDFDKLLGEISKLDIQSPSLLTDVKNLIKKFEDSEKSKIDNLKTNVNRYIDGLVKSFTEKVDRIKKMKVKNKTDIRNIINLMGMALSVVSYDYISEYYRESLTSLVNNSNLSKNVKDAVVSALGDSAKERRKSNRDQEYKNMSEKIKNNKDIITLQDVESVTEDIEKFLNEKDPDLSPEDDQAVNRVLNTFNKEGESIKDDKNKLNILYKNASATLDMLNKKYGN